MRKVIALPLVFASFASIAGGIPSGEVQPYPEYLAAYVKTLITAGCEQTLKGGSGDALIKLATQGMKKDTPSYYTVYNSVIDGIGAGQALKAKGRLITKDKIAIDKGVCNKAIQGRIRIFRKDILKAGRVQTLNERRLMFPG